MKRAIPLGAMALGLVLLYAVAMEWPDDPGGGEPGSEAEGYAKKDLQSTCDPTVKKGVAFFREYVLARFGGYDAGIVRDCAVGGSSEHKEGRAWDWGTAPNGPGAPIHNTAQVDEFFQWLTANEDEVIRRAGVMYIIWNRKMWRAYGPREWLPYTGSDAHTTHVHLSFSWAGARGQTSFYKAGHTIPAPPDTLGDNS